MTRGGLFVAVLLTGCSTLVPQPPEQVSIAVAASCIPKDSAPIRPKIYSDAELSTLDDFRFVLALRWNADRLEEYSRELEALLSACR